MAYRRILANLMELIIGADRIILDSDAVSGAGTLTVQNIIGVNTNNILFIGEPGNEKSEIIATHASTAPSGTTVTLAATLKEPHPAGTTIYIIRANQVQFYHSTTQVDANVDASTLSSLAAAQNIDPTEINNHFDDLSFSSGFYYYRFSDSINSVNLFYSAAIPWQEFSAKFNPNQVGYVLSAVARKLGFDWSDKFSKQDAMDEINACFQYVDGKQLRWPKHFIADYVLGQLSMGGFEFTLPTNIYDANTNRSVLQMRIAGQTIPLVYRDEREFTHLMDNAVHTTVRVSPAIGAISLQIVDSDNFPGAASGGGGTVHIFTNNTDDAITYTGVTVSATLGVLTGIPASGDGSIALQHAVGANVWSEPQQAQPWWYTIVNGKARVWPLANSSVVNKDILLDYYTVAQAVTMESDLLDEDRYDMVKHWVLWKAKSYVRNNGKDDLQDADYIMFQTILADAIKTKSSGGKFKWKPKINRILYPGRRTSREDIW